jgi:hypothetical protein
MFNPFIKQKAEVSAHWIAFADAFACTPSEFYQALEQEIMNRKVPGLTMSRIEFAEGGLLSDKRVYLRMLRERLVFDICAAPFGTRFFFSCRAAQIPPVISLVQLAVVLIGLFVVCGLSWKYLGLFYGTAALAVGCVALVYVLRNAVALGLQDLDTALVQSPVFGSIYELWFRRETYYRIDTRLMYLDTVTSVVKTLAEEVTAAKGIKLTREFESAPVLGELYRKLPPRSGHPAPDMEATTV